MNNCVLAPNLYLFLSTAAPQLLNLPRLPEHPCCGGSRTLCPVQHTESYLCVVAGVNMPVERLVSQW